MVPSPSPHAQDPRWADLGEATWPQSECISAVSLLKRVSIRPHESQLVRSLNVDQSVILELEYDPMARVVRPKASTSHCGGLADRGVPIRSNTQSKGPGEDGDGSDGDKDEDEHEDEPEQQQDDDEGSDYEPDALPGIEEWDL
jgi:hypothetical protein